MANPSSTNTGQEYYWNSEAAQQNIEYFPVPNYPPPNYIQPVDYNSSCPYNASDVSGFDPTNSIYRTVPPPTYHCGSGGGHNISYQNQMNEQCDSYNSVDFSQQSASNSYNMNWSTNPTDTYNENQTCNNWSTDNPTTNWVTYQDTPISWYDVNKTCDDEQRYTRRQYEHQPQTKKSKYKYDNKESLPNYTNNRNRFRSPSSSDRLEKSYRPQYEDHRDKYHKYDKERSNLRESKYKSKDFERRSSYKKHDSHETRSTRSKTPHTGSKYRKRSRSQESHASRDATQTGNLSKRKCLTERELLLEKYR